MKKIVPLVLVLLAVPVVLALSANGEMHRVYVTGNPTSRVVAKGLFGARHEFPEAFSVEVTSAQLKVLEKIPGIAVESVQLYHIMGRPVCGDIIIHPSEQCGEPGLPECPVGYVCENCKCVESGGTTTTTTIPSRSCYPDSQYPWGITKVNGGSGGTGVNVAVLDTGVYKDHLDLDVKLCKDATKRGIRNGCSDGNGHGTHVSGTVAATGGSDGLGIYGVAPEANLWMIKVCGNSGMCWTDDMAAGIRYATNQGANIISMSIGGDTESSLVKDAIDYATSNDVLVIAAAGNDGHIDGYGSIDYPAANVKVVAVAAFDSSDNMAYFSSLGVNDNDWTIEEKEIEFAAPGVYVESTWKDGCYNTISGTSMATPHVAGLAALHWQGSASATRYYLQDLAEYYTQYVFDYGRTGDDIEAGFGLPIPSTT